MHETIGRDTAAGRADEAKVAFIPADRQFGNRARPRLGRAVERLLVGGTRNRGDRIGGAERERLETRRDGAADPALRVYRPVGPRADRSAPLAYPGILIIENERDAESTLQQ